MVVGGVCGVWVGGGRSSSSSYIQRDKTSKDNKVTVEQTNKAVVQRASNISRGTSLKHTDNFNLLIS
jgi:hypothetical protein